MIGSPIVAILGSLRPTKVLRLFWSGITREAQPQEPNLDELLTRAIIDERAVATEIARLELQTRRRELKEPEEPMGFRRRNG